MRFITLCLVVLICHHSELSSAQDLRQQNEMFWHTNANSGITWDITNEKRLPHQDNIEMSGSMVSGIITYKVDANNRLNISRDIIFPQLRNYTKPNESMYRAYLRSSYNDDILPVITYDKHKYEIGKLDSIQINGKISFFLKKTTASKSYDLFSPQWIKGFLWRNGHWLIQAQLQKPSESGD